ncbi:heme ABC exporter ATP-binding protein CcmA [Rhizobium sp.]|uniref:heme ABC exporter ATP-binding protein CcmA n=1 Tax=Rhizobium sp. TaxID=391 RepID=UPI000E890C75|nr:heme ABC exporter ATP-binding protein CcmA [Rhizobium sp.]
MRLKAENLSAKRGEDLLFRDISFGLTSGDALVLTGRNGSGKSTLLRVIAGFIRPERGSTTFESVSGESRTVREASHYLGHRNGMKAELSVRENLDFWKEFLGDFEGGHGLDVDEAADRIGLSSITHLPYGYLSAGQQRRFAMARLLVAYRPVWILDEPTAALDAKAEAMFSKMIGKHLSDGGMVLAATHQPLGLEGVQQLEMRGFEFDDLEEMV